MFQKRTVLILFSVCLLSGVLCYFIAKNLFLDFEVPKNGLIIEDGRKLAEDFNQISETELNKKPIEEKNLEEVKTVSTEQKVKSSTKIIYETYDDQDTLIETKEETPQYFLLDLTLKDIQKYYPDWMIVSFSDQKIVLRKNITDQDQTNYIVGQQDGYIAVFYEEEKSGISLHDLTSTPISSLSHEEQVRLNDGIHIIGDEQLARILEDYES